jgi:uncharacterized membrane protein YphA (DoxX/SURF4 family)
MEIGLLLLRLTAGLTLTAHGAQKLFGLIHLKDMVDPNYVVLASIEKKYLPRGRNRKV